MPLYSLLFGWEGVLPILVIAATFGILVRVQRLTDGNWPYVTAAIGIIGIVIWQSFAKTMPTSQSETIEVLDVSLPGALLLLPGWLVLVAVMTASYENVAGANKGSAQGRWVRLCMLALPTIPLVPIGWALPDSVGWLSPLVAALMVVGLGALIPRLDTLMLEANCRPRVT